ncbi:AEC family transporter [Siphonobacter sp.]|uniref:AEC family transporter n=1 Tax=Siphonobacter sp. TaxID=1869184 RepID=UPI003B3ACFAF
MEILQELLRKVLPLYGFIILGFFAARKWGLQSKWISKVMLYALIPLIIIENLLKADLAETAVIGAIVFILASLMNLPAMLTTRFLAKDLNPNMLKSSFSYYNIGWFGIPVVMALFGDEQMPLIISAYVGNALYGDTVCYYLMSRTKDIPVKESVLNVFKIPAIYACVLAIVLNVLEVEVPESMEVVGDVVSWVVSASGMLLIGITLEKIDFKKIPYATFAKILSVRYIAGAIILVALVFLEKGLIGRLDENQSKLMLLLASFPIAANLVVFATNLDTEKENSALLVGLSSIASLVLVPAVCLVLF